jgi:hypothetical protein
MDGWGLFKMFFVISELLCKTRVRVKGLSEQVTIVGSDRNGQADVGGSSGMPDGNACLTFFFLIDATARQIR